MNITDINLLAGDIFDDNAAKGFWDQPETAFQYFSADNTQALNVLVLPQDQYTKLKKAEKIALMHSELSEALEGIRKDKMDEHCPEFTSEEVELADALIRILDYAGGFKLRLGEAVLAKLAYNRSRPHKHGKSF